MNYPSYLEAAEITEVESDHGFYKIISDLPDELTADVAREIDLWLAVIDECEDVGQLRQLQFVRSAIDRYGKEALWKLAKTLSAAERQEEVAA